jgi:putative membrane protein
VKLADGLGTAADGAPALVDGSQQLSDEGTKTLVAKGEATAQSYGAQYAVIAAGAQRAAAEGMAYGAPEGAFGATAYSIEIAGADGEGASSLGRLILAIVLFAGGAGIATFVRRRWV